MKSRTLKANNMSIFDTLQYVKRAQKAGFSKEQAEFQAEEIVNIIDDKLVTKADLLALEQRLIIKIGGMLVIAVGCLTTIGKFLT